MRLTLVKPDHQNIYFFIIVKGISWFYNCSSSELSCFLILINGFDWAETRTCELLYLYQRTLIVSSQYQERNANTLQLFLCHRFSDNECYWNLHKNKSIYHSVFFSEVLQKCSLVRSNLFLLIYLCWLYESVLCQYHSGTSLFRTKSEWIYSLLFLFCPQTWKSLKVSFF